MRDGFLMCYLGAFGCAETRVLFFPVDFFLMDVFLMDVFLMDVFLVKFAFGRQGLFGRVDFFVMCLRQFLDFLFLVFFLKVVPAHDCSRLGPRLRFFVLRFHQARRQRRQLFLAEACSAVTLCVGLCFFLNFFGGGLRSFHYVLFRVRCSLGLSRFRFGFVVRQNPMRQAARKTARDPRARWHAHGGTRCGLLEIGLAFFRFMVRDRLGGRLCLAPAVLRERLAWQQNVIFTALRWGRARATVSACPVIATRIPLTLW